MYTNYLFGFMIMNIISMVILFFYVHFSLLPLGMASLVLKAIAELQEAWGTVKALGMFVATSMAFLACIAFVLLPCVYTLAVRRNPFKFISNMANAALTAFSTVSS